MRQLNLEECKMVGAGFGFGAAVFWASKVIGKGAVGATLGLITGGPVGMVGGFLIGTGVGKLMDLEYEAMTADRESKRVENYEY